MLSNRYIIFKITLYSNNAESIIVYTDSDFETSFIDKLLLFKDSLYKRLDTVLFITIYSIVDEKIVDKQIYLSIYIVDTEVILETRLYVIKDIKADVILDSNVLELS